MTLVRSAALSLALAFPPSSAFADEVVVFAAASLKTALDAVAADFEAATGHDVTISYAGSNTLAMQIIQGAPADVFLSAAVNWMDHVETAGLIVPGTRSDLFSNRLVLVGGADAAQVLLGKDTDLQRMLGDGKLAMALVDAVPAGQYGKAALESLGLWSSVQANVAQADNVRAALALVATGEAPYGIVYATDAAAEPKVRVVGEFPAHSHPPIRYSGALLTSARDKADTAFLQAIASPAGEARFAEQGFVGLE